MAKEPVFQADLNTGLGFLHADYLRSHCPICVIVFPEAHIEKSQIFITFMMLKAFNSFGSLGPGLGFGGIVRLITGISGAGKRGLPKVCCPAISCLIICLGLYPTPLWAQRADAVSSDRQGDFHSSRIRGNRGFYQQRYWLVVDPDRRGLNCRDHRGPVARFSYGDVLIADGRFPSDNAITQVNGETYLRITSERSYLHLDKRLALSPKPFTCQVRASAKFIAPINMDDFTLLKRQW